MKDLFIILFFHSFFICNIYSLDLEKIRAEILENHNYHRKRHQVDILVRNAEIEAVAQSYSDHLAEIDEMKHSGNKKYGENLFYCWASRGICVSGKTSSQSWYDEVKDYDYDNPGFAMNTGHFTQLVWKGSKQIGCGASCNNSNKCYVTCNYYPPGNYIGQFTSNVFPLKEDESSYSSYNEGMSTAVKVFLAIFIILLIAVIAFAVFHFVIKKRRFNEIKFYFIKSRI